MTALPENQLIQARALLQDIRKYVKDMSDRQDPFSSITDYRMVDVLRGLTLAEHGLSALITGEHYTEFQQMREAMKTWPDSGDIDLVDEIDD